MALVFGIIDKKGLMWYLVSFGGRKWLVAYACVAASRLKSIVPAKGLPVRPCTTHNLPSNTFHLTIRQTGGNRLAHPAKVLGTKLLPLCQMVNASISWKAVGRDSSCGYKSYLQI